MAATKSWRWLGVAMLVAAMSGCGGGGSEAPPPPAPSEGSATVDAAGGTVNGPDGVSLVIPPDAVNTATTFRIARDGGGAPEAGGLKLISPIYAITPHGTEFGGAARVRIPFDAAQLAPGTQPVLVKAQPGGGWTALVGDTVGASVSAADTPGLSYYAVGSCYTTRDAGVSGPEPLLYCPAAHQLRLTLRDGSGALMETPRSATGYALPATTISAPTTLNLNLSWTRPAGTSRSDSVGLWLVNAGLQPAQQPLTNLATNNNNFSHDRQIAIDPATVPGAGAAGGAIVRIRAWATYTVDAFYPGCVCFKPASWTFESEIPVRVVYSGTQPTITQQPANQAVSEGQSATFSVVAAGPNLSYQWSRHTGQAETVIEPSEGSGARSASHTTPATTFAQNNRLYTVRVCSNAGTALQQCINSNAALLTVAQRLVAPVFTTAPASITVTEGETVTLQAVASGEPAPTIGWSKLRAAGPFTAYDPICTLTAGSGTRTSASCALGAMTLADSGSRYVAGASNAAGSVDSPIATVTVLPRPVAPTVTSAGELSDRSIMAGASVSWSVTASGTAPISYAWFSTPAGGSRVGGIVCSGGASPGQSVNGGTLTLTNVPQACDGLRVEVMVSNAQGAANPAARVATLSVAAAPAAPQISVPLANRSVLEGTQVTFNVAATGSPASFSYTWTLNGAAVPNVVSGCTAASATCTFVAALDDSGKTVAARVANGVAPDATSSALLTVTSTDVPASITAQPQPQGVVVGASATFTIGVAGTPTPTVTWETSPDGITWSGVGSGTTLTLVNTTLAQNGLRVRAQVSNTTRVPGGTQANPVTSNEATLTVVSNLPPNVLTAVQVVTLANRSLALRPDNSVYAWGAWVDPVTGGYTTNGVWAKQPIRVQGLGPVRQVAIGSDYASWALGQDGTVWGWGYIGAYEAFAQGPSNTTLQFLAPVRLLESAGTPIDRVCQIEGTAFGVVMVRSEVVGGTCAAGEPRSVWYTAGIIGNTGTTGGYAVRYTPLDSGGTLLPAGRWIREVVTSRNHSIGPTSAFALANDGAVYAWGYLNGKGQLGLGNDSTQPQTPQLAPGWQGALRITSASEVTLALMPDGTLKGAGFNPGASLGIGPVSYDAVVTPTTLADIAGASDVSTASSNSGSMALVGGQLRYWGNNGLFATGAQTTPIPIAAPATPLTSVSVGGRVAVAIGPGFAVYAWGDAEYRGCQPNSTDCNASTPVPTLVMLP
jgi:alpha-tubulin suppressor-like RCC1 family protein